MVILKTPPHSFSFDFHIYIYSTIYLPFCCCLYENGQTISPLYVDRNAPAREPIAPKGMRYDIRDIFSISFCLKA